MLPIAHLIQLADAHPVLVCRNMLGHDVHGHLAEVHVSADASRGRDACLFQHVTDHLHCKLVSRHLVTFQISRYVHEHFVNAIDMNILGGNIFQVSLINLTAHLHVVCHAWRSRNIVQFPVRMSLQFRIIKGFPRKMPISLALAVVVHLPDTLHHLEQTGTTAYAVGFQRRRHRQADCLLRAACVSHHEIGGQRIEPPVHTLYRSIE